MFNSIPATIYLLRLHPPMNMTIIYMTTYDIYANITYHKYIVIYITNYIYIHICVYVCVFIYIYIYQAWAQ